MIRFFAQLMNRTFGIDVGPAWPPSPGAERHLVVAADFRKCSELLKGKQT